jgi:hypothetical protein
MSVFLLCLNLENLKLGAEFRACHPAMLGRADRLPTHNVVYFLSPSCESTAVPVQILPNLRFYLRSEA